MYSIFSWVLFVFLINSIVSCSEILNNDFDISSDSSSCTLGPEFWCRNLTTARECNTEDFCAENTWRQKGLILRDDDDVTLPCQFCNLLVNSITLSMKTTSIHILQFSCNFLGLGLVVASCKLIIKGIINGINSVAGPIPICEDINFCLAESSIKNLDHFDRPSSEFSLNADQAKELIGIEKLLHKKSKNIVKNKFLDASGNFSDQFATLMAQHIDDFYDHFITEESLNTIIDSVPEHDRVDLKSQTEHLPKKVCKKMITYIRNALASDENKRDILFLLRDICEMTAFFHEKATCMNLIESNFDLVSEFLVNELDSEQVCADVILSSGKKN